MSERSKTNKENHIQYMKDADSGFILQFEVGQCLFQRDKSNEATIQRNNLK